MRRAVVSLAFFSAWAGTAFAVPPGSVNAIPVFQGATRDSFRWRLLMRRAAAALFLALAFVPGLPVGGAREKPGDARFDVTDRVEELRLPISARPVTISLWAPLPPGAGVENLSQLLIYREASRRTGVTVAFVHSLPVPPAVLRCASLPSSPMRPR